MESEGQDSTEATQAAPPLPEISPESPRSAQPKSEPEPEEPRIHKSHDERHETQPDSESFEFEFQDAHLPLAVCLLW
jgi:hypothetical protein